MNTLTNWKEFFQFLKKPTYSKSTEGIKNKILLAFNSLLLKFLIVIPISILIVLYTFLTGEIETLGNMNDNLQKIYHPIILLLMVAIFEEFTFRGFLTKFNPILFSISVTGIVSYFYKKIIFNNMFLEPDGLIETGILAIILFLIFFLVGKKFSIKLSDFWDKNVKIIVYFSAFLFAFVHFFNSESWDISYLKTNVFQLIGAFILTFVRIRSGILYAIIIHFFWNLILNL